MKDNVVYIKTNNFTFKSYKKGLEKLESTIIDEYGTSALTSLLCAANRYFEKTGKDNFSFSDLAKFDSSVKSLFDIYSSAYFGMEA